MDQRRREAILIRLIKTLREKGSWCGETHVQKATYFLQEVLGVGTDFDFILYKHGPFSFDLSDELTAMRADGFVTLRIQDPYYGPSIVPGDAADLLERRFPKTLGRHRRQIEFVAEKFDGKTVTELERLGTALYVSRELGSGTDTSARAKRIHARKPHISVEQAEEAVRAVDAWEQEAKELLDGGR